MQQTGAAATDDVDDGCELLPSFLAVIFMSLDAFSLALVVVLFHCSKLMNHYLSF
jgi:hypothetical protein